MIILVIFDSNYYSTTPEGQRFFINICAPVLPQHLYDLSSCGNGSVVCMVTGDTATSLVSTTDLVTFIYEGTESEILCHPVSRIESRVL